MAKNLIDRGGTWWIYFRRDGKRYRESTGVKVGTRDDKQLAKDYLVKRQREVATAHINGEKKKPIPFAEFADDFIRRDSPEKKTKWRDQGVLERIKAHWRGETLDSITQERIEDYKAARLQTRKGATVAKELQIIGRLFKKAVEWGKLDKNPAQFITKPRCNNGRVRFLEPEELDRLLAKIPGWLRPIALFARFTGARRGEVLDLTWNDIDLKRGLIRLRETKNGEDATIEMNATTRAILASLPQPINRAQLVFGEEGNTPARVRRIERAWSGALKAAKIENFRFHDLRHQAATDLLTLGAGLNDVRDFLRHKSMVMTLRYAHLVRERRQATAGLLDRLSTKAATVR